MTVDVCCDIRASTRIRRSTTRKCQMPAVGSFQPACDATSSANRVRMTKVSKAAHTLYRYAKPRPTASCISTSTTNMALMKKTTSDRATWICFRAVELCELLMFSRTAG